MGCKEIYKQNSTKTLILLCVSFVIAMLFFSERTSPIYSSIAYGGDSAIFQLIGQGIRHGYTPYVDLFDHKGPILFFIEALGTFFGGYAIWVIQCIAGIITVNCFYLMWGILKQSGKVPTMCQSIFFPILISFLSFFIFFQGGNLTEELCVPFTAFSMLLFVRYCALLDTKRTHPLKFAFAYGVFFAIIAYIRLNNAVSICAIVLVIGIFLLINKEYKNALMNIVFGLFGIITVSIPVFFWYWRKNAVYEMLNATFIHNFKYVEFIGDNTILSIFKTLQWKSIYELVKSIYFSNVGIRFLPLFVSTLLLLIRLWGKKKTHTPIHLLDFGVLAMILLNAGNLILSNAYLHYFTTSIPVFTFSMLVYGNAISSVRAKKVAVSLLLFVFTAYNIAGSYSMILGLSTDKMEMNAIQADFERIPLSEKSSVIGYNIPSKFYLYGNVIPCEKYYTLQNWWSVADPQIWIDFIDSLENNEPLWILTTPQNNNNDVCRILEVRYHLIHEDNYMKMYHLQKDEVTP